MTKTRDMFEADKVYGAEGRDVLIVERVMMRLYGEKALSGDERRDLANALFAALHGFIEINP